MEKLRFILTGLLMSVIFLPVKGELITIHSDYSIEAYTTANGVKGYKGCQEDQLEEIPAFKFELYKSQGNSFQVCRANNSNKWRKINTIISEDGQAKFNNLKEGQYKVICYSGHAIGCEINGDTGNFPDRSIVLEKEVSSIINISNDNQASSLPSGEFTPPGQLKVFPNPANDKLNIQLSNTEFRGRINISLIDLLGQVMLSETHAVMDKQGEYLWTFDIQRFPPGAYFIYLSDKQGANLQEKILIQKNQ